MLRDATKNVRVFALGGMFGTSALVFATIQRMLPTMAKWQKATWVCSLGAIGAYAGIHFAGPNCLKKLVLLPDSKLADEARRIVLERRSSIPNAETLIRNFPVRKFEDEISRILSCNDTTLIKDFADEPRKYSSFAPDGSYPDDQPNNPAEDTKKEEASKIDGRVHARRSERPTRWTEDFQRNPRPRHVQSKAEGSSETPEAKQRFRPDQYDPYQGLNQEAKELGWFDQGRSKAAQRTNQFGDPV
eukprot:766772-Hanusia_phi.AAC.9